MLTYIKINGFKSFHNFEMEFTPFTIIAGTNASGKSNLFDALRLIAQIAEVDNLKKAFRGNRGEMLELFTQYGENDYATEMEFCVEMLVDKKVTDSWGNEAILKYTRLRYELKVKRYTNATGIEDLAVVWEHLENLKHKEDKWIKLVPNDFIEVWRPKVETGKRGTPYIETEEKEGNPAVNVPQDGTGGRRRFPLNNASRTVLSSFDTVDFPHILAAKKEMLSWGFLEFNSDDLRQPTNKNNGEDIISPSGKNLAAVLYRIKQQDSYTLIEIQRKLQTFLPNFIEIDVLDDIENKQYLIKLKDRDKKVYTSRVLSEGTLRILALCILDYDDKHTGLLCFEEPENGIHPYRIDTMVKLLKDLSSDFKDNEMPLRQVIINTHSPVLVGKVLDNYLTDKNVTILISQMVNRSATINNQKTGLNVTVMENPFDGFTNNHTLSGEIFSESERKAKKTFAFSKIEKYLETNDFEKLKQKINQNG